MKSIGFAANLVKLIKNGSKTLTYRLGDKYDFLEIGDKIEFRDSSNNQVIGLIEINKKDIVQFIDLPTNRDGHEVYQSKEEMKKIFEGYYQQPIDDQEKFLVLGFRLLKLY